MTSMKMQWSVHRREGIFHRYEETDMQKLGSKQQLQSAETELAYPRLDKLLQNREHERIM